MSQNKVFWNRFMLHDDYKLFNVATELRRKGMISFQAVDRYHCTTIQLDSGSTPIPIRRPEDFGKVFNNDDRVEDIIAKHVRGYQPYRPYEKPAAPKTPSKPSPMVVESAVAPTTSGTAPEAPAASNGPEASGIEPVVTDAASKPIDATEDMSEDEMSETEVNRLLAKDGVVFS